MRDARRRHKDNKYGAEATGAGRNFVAAMLWLGCKGVAVLGRAMRGIADITGQMTGFCPVVPLQVFDAGRTQVPIAVV